jgi:hypothetical protein
MIPDVLKWQTDRKTWVNVLCIVLALAYIVLVGALLVLSAFVSAIFGLALKK